MNCFLDSEYERKVTNFILTDVIIKPGMPNLQNRFCLERFEKCGPMVRLNP